MDHRELKVRSAKPATDRKKFRKRLTAVVFLTSAALAAVWYLINIPYDVLHKVLPVRPPVQSDSTQSPPAPSPSGISRPTNDRPADEKHPPSTTNAIATPDHSFAGSPNRYENVAILRKQGKRQAAILLWPEDNGDAPTNLQSLLADLVVNQGVQAVQSFFTPEFVRTGQGSRLMAGDWGVARHLELDRHVDYVLLGSTKVMYQSNEKLEGLLTANLSLELKCLDAVTSNVCGAQSLAVPGAGYTRQAALASAVDHMKPQLESLVQFWIH